MEKFIGVKIIKAKRMKSWEPFGMNPPGTDGYKVGYPDAKGNFNGSLEGGCHYISWSPVDVFEAAYLGLSGDGTKIVESTVNTFIGELESKMIDEKTTYVKAKTLTGFVQHEMSSCVDPKNYDHKIGVDSATERIKNTIWKNLGFVLQWGLYGLKK